MLESKVESKLQLKDKIQSLSASILELNQLKASNTTIINNFSINSNTTTMDLTSIEEREIKIVDRHSSVMFEIEHKLNSWATLCNTTTTTPF